jgi:tetratricopeptide (TPR) repeat protein
MTVRMIVAAFCLALLMAGCAGSQGSMAGAKEACDKALDRMSNAQGCDRYVAAAVASKDAEEIFDAHYTRAILREFMGDLPAAIADIDQAIAAQPKKTLGHLRRAALLAESGDYKEALKQFAHHRISDPTPVFDETVAMAEYVAGDRAKAVALFQSAARDYAENDHDENMAAFLRFNAAIIESELRGGDLAPIEAQDVSSRTDTMLPLLKQHRLGQMSDAELLDRVAGMTGGAARGNRCDAYFSVGHRNALAGDTAAAKEGFRKTVEGCSPVTFEYHAAKAWLKQLGG